MSNLEDHEAEQAKITAAWQINARETFDAMVTMRNAINEHIPMPSLESDLLSGPENSVFCAAVAEAVVGAVRELRSELELRNAQLQAVQEAYPATKDILRDRIKELTAKT